MSEGWWEVLVTLQFVASDFVLRHLIYRQAIGSLPVNGSGGGSCTHGGKAYEAHLNLILPAVKNFGACCLSQSRLSQMPVKKCPARTCFQVAFKSHRPTFIFECGCRSNNPRTKLRCVWDFPRIMIIQSVLQVFRLTCINLIRLRKGLQRVNVVIIIHNDRPASVSKRQETTAGSLRLSRGFPIHPSIHTGLPAVARCR